MQYHLTSSHRNRQVFGQTGLLVSIDGDGGDQYTNSAAYRSATTNVSSNDLVTGRDHLSCPVAITTVRDLVTNNNNIITGSWELYAPTLVHLLPKWYPNLHGFYATVEIGQCRCLLKLLAGTGATTFVGQPCSLLELIDGAGVLDAAEYFPRLHVSGELSAASGTQICHLFRAPPVFYLESVSERVQFVWGPSGNRVLCISVRNDSAYLRRLVHHIETEPSLLLHIGGTEAILDTSKTCASNIYGVDEILGLDQVVPRYHGDTWWQLRLRLGRHQPVSPDIKGDVLLPSTSYIEAWVQVKTPLYGPSFALNRIMAPQPHNLSPVKTVRLLYTTLPTLGVLRVSGRMIMHVSVWWVAVRFDDRNVPDAVTPSLLPQPGPGVPSWVLARGTLLFRVNLDKYTNGVSLALQMACPQPVAELAFHSSVSLGDLGLPRVCVFSDDGEILDLVPSIGGEDIPIEGGAPLADDIVYVGLQIT